MKWMILRFFDLLEIFLRKKIGSLLKNEMDKMTLISLNQVSFQSRMMAPHHFSKVKSSIQMSWFWTWEAQGAAKAKKKKIHSFAASQKMPKNVNFAILSFGH